MAGMEVDKRLKAAYKEALEPYGFRKLKGRHPYFVRMVTPEIVQVISYKYEPAIYPMLEKKFQVRCGIGTIYRPELNFKKSPLDNYELILQNHYSMYQMATRNGIEVFEKPPCFCEIKKGDEDSLRENIESAISAIKNYVIPAFDKVKSLKDCVDYFETYNDGCLNVCCKLEVINEAYILPEKYPDIESYKVYKVKAHEQAQIDILQMMKDGLWNITEEEYEQQRTRNESMIGYYVERYNQFLNDEDMRAEIEKIKAERAERNRGLLRAFGFEV